MRFSQVLALALLAGLPRLTLGAPAGLLPVGDPLEAELRALDVIGPWEGSAPLPHVNSLPLQRREIPIGPLPSFSGGGGLARVSWERLARELGRDIMPAAVRGTTPRLLQRSSGDERFEASLGLVGSAAWTRDPRWSAPTWRDASGLRARITFASGSWLAHSDLAAGTLRDARRFTDALIEGRDVALITEDSYLLWGASARNALWVGRSRWHWGPGEEASLLLSRTGPAVSGAALRARIEPLRADLTALHATLDPAAGEQLAAHRIEWQPGPALRIGVSESARYRASGWQAVYLASVIPFSLAQRLIDHDSGSPDDSVRNNVMAAADLSWRVATGTRLYGEVLLDDLHLRSERFPDKWGWQLGLDGVGAFAWGRLTWNAEATRLSRWVYTSYYGRSHVARGEWLGHPSGPDSRKLRLRVSWDPSSDWRLTAMASQSHQGERAELPFVPGDEHGDPMTFGGTRMGTRRLEGEVVWSPASGTALAFGLAHERLENAGHVPGAERSRLAARAALRLER